MVEYIDCNEASIELKRIEQYLSGDKRVSIDVIIDSLRSISKADVVPVVHGLWLGQSGIYQGKCSVCGYMTFDKTADWARTYWPYCPKCGARMDLE